MPKFTATLANGKTFKRTSTKPYTHFWYVTWSTERGEMAARGFATSADFAQKAANSTANQILRLKYYLRAPQIEIVEAQRK
jgi:hypothetical protein